MKIESIEQLRALYNTPGERARKKQLASLEQHATSFIQHSPFLILSTFDKNGKVDASPRGGQPGFVHVLNNNEIIIPDAKGNNRLDSLGNIIETGQVGLLFLIPGIDETLRLNGKAHITTDPLLLEKFTTETKPPKTCIVVTIDEVFLHCAKAFMRSKLWSQEVQISRASFPTMGQMLKDQIGEQGEPESQEMMVKRYQKDL